MSRQDEIIETVDELADAISPDRVEAEADRLEMTPRELMTRVADEVVVRLTGGVE